MSTRIKNYWFNFDIISVEGKVNNIAEDKVIISKANLNPRTVFCTSNTMVVGNRYVVIL